MLEPAGKGKAVIYGPHVENFSEEAALLEGCGAAVRVSGTEALAEALRRNLEHPDEARELGRRALQAVSSAKGAAAVNVLLIREQFLERAGDLLGPPGE
jgi:3-deoxy-D-manno-octulosonic-acid transferase